jgi:PTS system nitrogen regulatory IIA component
MEIDTKAAARLLMVPERTVLRWIKRDDLPAARVNNQYRFNRVELLEWATARGIEVSPDLFKRDSEEEGALPGLEDAIRAGGVHYDVRGTDKPGVLAAVVDLMKLPQEVNRAQLLGILLARESLGSTGIGDGIAIPHVRNPIVAKIPCAAITLCFLENPIEFDSPDGKPVHTLFTMVSPTIRVHLHLLSRLTYALRKPVFFSAITGRERPDSILSAARAALA